jgi:hypothetical protein
MSHEQTAQPAIKSSPQTKITHAARLRVKFKLLGGALASIGAVGAIVGGLTGYWNAWKVVSTDLLNSALRPNPRNPRWWPSQAARRSRCSHSRIARATPRTILSQMI